MSKADCKYSLALLQKHSSNARCLQPQTNHPKQINKKPKATNKNLQPTPCNSTSSGNRLSTSTSLSINNNGQQGLITLHAKWLFELTLCITK